MRKIVMILLLAILIVTTGCSIKGGEHTQKVNQEKVTVAAKEENFNTEFIEVKLKLPQVSDMQNKEAQAEINKQFNSIYMLKDSMEKEAKQAAVELKQSGIPFRPYQLVADYNVSYNQKGFLSLTTIVYTFTGGAHGATAKTTYNVDINSGKLISLKSMFKGEVNYKDLINQEIRKQIAKDPTNYFKEDEGFKTIAENQNFYLKEGKIVVYFSQYEIAPYSTGIPEFEMQLNQLKDSLKPKYQVI